MRPRYLSWHPVVLEEIALKDFAPNETHTVHDQFGIGCMTELDAGLTQQIRYVPLPTFETGSMRRDPEHQEIKSPRFLTSAPIGLYTEIYLG
ncbi:MAG: hypothetical protein KDA78_04135 [Planctomycetaceae bacterium]|nr:hypothetical protein [Planctomycetaceae bacterium]